LGINEPADQTHPALVAYARYRFFHRSSCRLAAYSVQRRAELAQPRDRVLHLEARLPILDGQRQYLRQSVPDPGRVLVVLVAAPLHAEPREHLPKQLREVRVALRKRTARRLGQRIDSADVQAVLEHGRLKQTEPLAPGDDDAEQAVRLLMPVDDLRERADVRGTGPADLGPLDDHQHAETLLALQRPS